MAKKIFKNLMKKFFPPEKSKINFLVFLFSILSSINFHSFLTSLFGKVLQSVRQRETVVRHWKIQQGDEKRKEVKIKYQKLTTTCTTERKFFFVKLIWYVPYIVLVTSIFYLVLAIFGGKTHRAWEMAWVDERAQ